jgi:TetR/AcrR family transcriptional regulator, transcriptional repressor for nem operon
MRERIVSRAAELFAQKTVHAVGLRDIQAAAGVSKSQLYHYFTDKDDLVHAVIDHQRRVVVGGHTALLDEVRTWADLRRWLDAVVVTNQADGGRGGCRLGTLAASLAQTDDAARAALADCFAGWQVRIATALINLRDAGLLHADADPGSLATATLAAVEGGQLLAQLTRSPEPLRTALDAAYAHLRIWATGPQPAPDGS